MLGGALRTGNSTQLAVTGMRDRFCPFSEHSLAILARSSSFDLGPDPVLNHPSHSDLLHLMTSEHRQQSETGMKVYINIYFPPKGRPGTASHCVQPQPTVMF